MKDNILKIAELISEVKKIIDTDSNILTVSAEVIFLGNKAQIHVYDVDLSEFGETIETPFNETQNKLSFFIDGVEIFKLINKVS